MGERIDLTGQRFGRWTALHLCESYPYGQPRWVCRCDCGKIGSVRGSNLRQGESRSCGCLNADTRRAVCLERNITHGRSKTIAYKRWTSMIQRCTNPKTRTYRLYGAKGIRVCARWRASFEDFLADMGEPPTRKYTLDRIDPRGNYEPGNCRWIDMRAQQNNRTNNRRLTFNGETMTLQQWSRRFGVGRATIAARLQLGWTLETALTKPADPTAGRFRSR